MAFSALSVDAPCCNKAESFESAECAAISRSPPFVLRLTPSNLQSAAAHIHPKNSPWTCVCEGSANLFKAICTIELSTSSRCQHAGAKQSRRPKLIRFP